MREASIFRARVPEGSLSQASGKRFAAQWIRICGLWNISRRYGLVLGR